jgi:hypothetical protein
MTYQVCVAGETQVYPGCLGNKEGISGRICCMLNQAKAYDAKQQGLAVFMTARIVCFSWLYLAAIKCRPENREV